ncbi:MAG: hypothetical protein BWX73_03445 [Lentisphaerae bacterium ADurb.Bin082]|nr:MAG: hypothetical protein BWX73_03445 [Lentisphaerae bacterium ADurb.Bin082]
MTAFKPERNTTVATQETNDEQKNGQGGEVTV